MKRAFLQIACILILLFSQQSAFTHAAWHARNQHAPAQQDGKHTFQGELCDLHSAFAQVLGTAPGYLPQMPVHEAVTHRGDAPACACIAARLLRARSRGPPVIS